MILKIKSIYNSNKPSENRIDLFNPIINSITEREIPNLIQPKKFGN